MQNDSKSKLQIETELSRDLGLTAVLAIGVGTMIAAGIFTLSGLAIRNVGSSAIVSFLLAGAVSMFTALTYCEFVSIYPDSGEAYLYSRKTFRALLAYLVGWALLLGYASSCAFYLASLSKYFYEFVLKTPIETISGVLALFALTLLNMKGTKESGHFQIVVTLAKVVLLSCFVVAGLSNVDLSEISKKMSYDIGHIAATSAMVFITFFGFSAIAASAGEVKDPVKTIPKGIFISMGLVTLLYSAVVLVLVAAGLQEYTEAAMGNAAQQYMGKIGGYVIIGGGIFSMISASNASIMAGSRVMLTMSNLGQLPAALAAVNKKTRTPVVSLALVGAAIFLFIVSLGVEDLAHFADAVLLVALLFVNAALIVHRRKYPDIERPFRVPLVPLFPALGIIANLYLLLQIVHHPIPLAMAGGSLLFGVFGYMLWKGSQPDEMVLPGSSSLLALAHSVSSAEGPTEHPFRILVPIANPDNVGILMELAASIAKERNGEIITLRVAVIPEQVPPSREDPLVAQQTAILNFAHNEAMKYDVPVTSLVRVGHDPGRAILETCREHDCNLIVLGWKGFTTTRERILGEVVDNVVNHARADVMLVKRGSMPYEAGLHRKYLIPTGGSEHAQCAVDYMASVLKVLSGSVTLLSVVSPGLSDKDCKETLQRLQLSKEKMRAENEDKIETRVVASKSISDTIIKESEDFDIVVVGATRASIYPQIIFGSIPESVATNVDIPVILVKHYHPVKALLGRVIGEE